ncbi:MAG: 3-deoxy-manno-octulosonate cytidylyltransferase [Bacteroidetes bacterium]|jgi:3-deoxy-manno-octulosonate cytidylyltransferase (CMP-KDO synthetase)|nr:3-deoxy-manno-octulosonate cytidylyltransferase [Bacteroidota bacterium]
MENKLTAIAIIPARYSSTRFPGKPLADIGGQSMLQRVFQQTQKTNSISRIIIATDDSRILNHANDIGAEAMMTSEKHPSGTDRIAEVISKLETSYDVVVNVQGDEPFINPSQIDELVKMFSDDKVDIGTMVKPLSSKQEYENPNVVKAVLADNGNVLYFSRSSIPYFRKGYDESTFSSVAGYKHLGMYAYRSNILKKVATLSPSSLEEAEQLEQLRWLQNGLSIRACITQLETIAIDTPDDLQRAIMFFNNQQKH